MRAPSVRFRRIVSLSAAPVAVLLAGVMVWQGSNAAFSSSTHSYGNSWATGSVDISNNAGGAVFSVQNLVPMQTGSNCITVTTHSNVPGLVKTYFSGLVADGLQDYVKLGIQEGSGGAVGDCTNFVAAGASHPLSTLSSLAGMHTSYANATLPWTINGITSGESQQYKFSWLFDTSSLTQVQIDALQGKTASINIDWELQNT